MVPPAGVLLPAILEPTLALHGGRTPTQALVPGSRLSTRRADMFRLTGTPLTTDQRGRPRPVDGNGDGLVACDIGAVQFFPLVNDLVTWIGIWTRVSIPRPCRAAPPTFTVTATFTNAAPRRCASPF